MSETIPHWLTKQAYVSPNSPAIEFENGVCMNFKQLKDASESFARKLAQMGIKRGNHIGILSTNDASMVIAIHALSYLGAISVLLNIRLTEEELRYQMNDAELKTVLICESLKSTVEQMNFPVPFKTFAEVGKLKEKEVLLKEEIQLNDIFTIIYTSGTTGNPKGVMHSFGNHWWSAIGSALNLGLSKSDKWLAVLPIFHVGGLSIFIRSVIYGIPVYLLEKFDEKSFHHAIFEKGVTIASVVTVMLQRLVVDLEEKCYPNTFRCMLLGGGPAPKKLLEEAKHLQIPVFQSYGMTETSSQIVTLSPKDALEQLGSSGKSLFPAQLKIMNPNPDGIGEIFVKGPMVTQGYFKNPTANNKAFLGEWLATGDLGYVDNEGFLYVVDRRTDLIISGGENIYPTEVENVLLRMDEIKEVGVVGVADEKWGQIPVACIVTHMKVSANTIISYAKKHLASYKVPKKIYFVDQLPRNASNKLVRGKLVELFRSN